MFSFKVFTKKSAVSIKALADDVLPVKNADALLNPHMNKLYQLKHLVSVTPEDYQHYYMDLIQSVARLFQQLPSPCYEKYSQAGDLLKLTLERVVTALKLRRAYMLPAGADTETCYKEQDVWTYAIFTASLLKDVWQVGAYFEVSILDSHRVFNWNVKEQLFLSEGQHYRYTLKTAPVWQPIEHNYLLCESLLPAIGLMWLRQHPQLFEEWLQIINGEVTVTSKLCEIIQNAESYLNQSSLKNNEVESPIILNSLKKDKGQGEMISAKSNKVEAAKTSHESALENSLLQENLQTELEKPVASKPDDKAEAFILWLKNSLANKKLSINEKDALVHLVAEGLLLVFPAIIEIFIADTRKQETVTAEQPSTYLKYFTKSHYFLSKSKKKLLHGYYVGDWHDRNTIEGLLITPAYLFKETALPPLNEQLQSDFNIHD